MTQIGDVDWAELLQPWVLGELARSELGGHVKHVAREVIVDLGGQSGVTIRHGMAKTAAAGESERHVIDADFYTEQRVEGTDVIAILDGFDRESGRLFRWYITDRLHLAMGPRAVAAPPG